MAGKAASWSQAIMLGSRKKSGAVLAFQVPRLVLGESRVTGPVVWMITLGVRLGPQSWSVTARALPGQGFTRGLIEPKESHAETAPKNILTLLASGIPV